MKKNSNSLCATSLRAVLAASCAAAWLTANLAAVAQPSAAVAAPPAAPPMEQPLSALPYTPSLDVPSMDKTVDPCVDFYQYSCGGWRKNNPIPADQSSWSVYGKLEAENEQFLWGILDQSSKATGRTPAQQKIGDYFGACMDETVVNGRGFAPIQPELDSIAALKAVPDLTPYLAHLEKTLPGSFCSPTGPTRTSTTRPMSLFLWGPADSGSPTATTTCRPMRTRSTSAPSMSTTSFRRSP